jgi:hypothetical protein
LKTLVVNIAASGEGICSMIKMVDSHGWPLSIPNPDAFNQALGRNDELARA